MSTGVGFDNSRGLRGGSGSIENGVEKRSFAGHGINLAEEGGIWGLTMTCCEELMRCGRAWRAEGRYGRALPALGLRGAPRR